MISITSDVKRFFEKEKGRTVLYGAGNSGYWTGYYMNRCGLDFSCYLDRDVIHRNVWCNEKPILPPKELKSMRGEKLKIVVTPRLYESVMFDLTNYTSEYGVDVLCFIPKYRSVINDTERYNINRFLGYFRRRLFTGTIPSIIANDCTAGLIYEMMNMAMLSPTINCGIYPEDFLRLCSRPEYYFAQELKDWHWMRGLINPGTPPEYPEARMGDIRVFFSHYGAEDGCFERISEHWRLLCKRIDYEHLVFLMSDMSRSVIPILTRKEFCRLPERHLLMSRRNHSLYLDDEAGNVLFMAEHYFNRTDTAIENFFDLLGWLNGLWSKE